MTATPGTTTSWLRRDRDFQRLWSAQAVSDVGSQVGSLALPLVGVPLLRWTLVVGTALLMLTPVPLRRIQS